MATPEQAPLASRQPGNDLRQDLPDESTPLLNREENAVENGEDEGRAAVIGRRLRRWKQDRWISLCVSILLVAVVIVLLVLFGGSCLYQSASTRPRLT